MPWPHLPPHGTRVGNVLRLPLALVPKGAMMPILQGPLRGKRWLVGSGPHGCWLGTYEYDKQRQFALAIRPGAVVYDLGANVGYYALIAATRGGRVVAVEPFPRNVSLLRRHLDENRMTAVEVIEAAVSDRVGMAPFLEGSSPSMGRLRPDGVFSPVSVRTVSLDHLVFSQGFPPPNVIKMDIEGAEALALKGAARILKAERPTIFLATHGHEVKTACLAILRSAGYCIRSIDSRPLDESDELLAE